ncbi:hypothetical protein [Vibrio parahaemolyticus]|uniref:hypothetical protein n=1 Tax=Vibrio parahaemolyticus TaxID=670 RepID=UPI003D815522
MSKEYFLVQKVVTNGEEINIEHVHMFAYIESGSMDGNKLIMDVMDQAAIYRDNFKIQKGSILNVTLADTTSRGDQVWIENFVVGKATSENGELKIEAFHQDAHLLKEQVIKPRFFVNKQPREILAELLPHLKLECDMFDKGATYHLNAGGTKSRLIRIMARDYGAMAFINRGTMYFKSIKNITMTEQFKLEYSNPDKADYSIARYSIIGEEALFERVLNRNYIAWDTVQGMQSAGNGPAVVISVNQAKALKNQRVSIIPVLDVELTGNTQFKPMCVCSVLFHKQLPVNELDESLPEKQIINQVVHYQSGNRYQCRLELGVKNL